jgi:hypothetical protein
MRVRFGAPLLACAALAACSTDRPAAGAAPVSALRSISVETNSWGKPITDWTIGRDGNGRYTFSRDVPGGRFRDYDLVTRRFAVGAADFAKVEALLAGARAYAGGAIPCTLQISDGLYGRIAWSEGGEALGVPFNVGCLSPTANAIYRQLHDAREHVKTMAEAGETIEVKQVREPRG